MSLTERDLAHLLVALVLLLAAAHGVGYLFQRFRQPRVIGEILGGILLGPTLLGRVLPDVYQAVFTGHAPTSSVLGAIYQLGLALLLFCSGVEIRSRLTGDERRAVVAIAVAGTAVPFFAALGAGSLLDLSMFHGAAATDLSFDLVLAVATAVTSIPVISRIFLDLGLLDTPFARIVLGAAVLEDVLLYVVLALALSLSSDPGQRGFQLSSLLGLEPGGAAAVLFHVVATLLFFAFAFGPGRRVYAAVSRFRFNVLSRGSPIGHLLVFLLVLCGISIFLGINVVFGAFLAGIIAGAAPDTGTEAREAIKQFSAGFFIPVYFALVGLRLDLVRDVPWLFLGAFLVAASILKGVGVYAGARFAGRDRGAAVSFAVAMNARGGPGIVLASVALDAGLIDVRAHVALVLVAIVTSLAAGTFLDAAVRSGRRLH